jgi:hypothetical protein
MKPVGRQIQIEYVGFTSTEATRTYQLRVKEGADWYAFTLEIANQAFLDHRVRYQDGPDVCFLKLQKELAGCVDGGLPAKHLSVSDADLLEYKDAHAPKPPQRRRTVPPVTS